MLLRTINGVNSVFVTSLLMITEIDIMTIKSTANTTFSGSENSICSY